ncbi:MAG: DUF1573 domain-containing protein [Bacteroidales bacterium]
MNVIKSYILTICFLAISALSHGQNKAVIVFDRNEHDFGQIIERDGNVTTIFKFENKGNAPLVINQVIASCGCTTPEYPKNPISPGKSGEIKVTYNPLGRPGYFTKSVIVLNNGEPSRAELKIKGVTKSESMDLSVRFPINMGKIKVNKRSLDFGSVNAAANAILRLDVLNTSNEPISLKFKGLPAHISAISEHDTIKANEIGSVYVTYKAHRIKDWGSRDDNFYILYNNEERITPDRKINISANIKEDFSKLSSSQMENAPRIEVSPKTLFFNDVSKGTTKTEDIRIKNNGNSVLHIRKIASSNPAFKVETPKMSLTPGNEMTIQISFDSKQAKRNASGKIIIITNVPSDPETEIPVSGNLAQ